MNIFKHVIEISYFITLIRIQNLGMLFIRWLRFQQKCIFNSSGIKNIEKSQHHLTFCFDGLLEKYKSYNATFK